MPAHETSDDVNNRKLVISLIDPFQRRYRNRLSLYRSHRKSHTHAGLSLTGDFKRYLQEVANNISRTRCARSSCTTYHYPRCRGMIYLLVFKLPRFVLEFISAGGHYARKRNSVATFVARETFKIYEDWSPILSGFEEESRSLVLDTACYI